MMTDTLALPMDVLEKINGLSTRLKNEDDYHQVLIETCQQHGFDRALFARLYQKNINGTSDKKVIQYSLDEWLCHYRTKEYLMDDIIIQHSFQWLTPLLWSKQTNVTSKKSQLILNEASEFGLNSGITFPLPSRSFARSMITFYSAEHDLSKLLTHDAVNDFKLIGDLFAQYCLTKTEKQAKEIQLTQRQLDCLRWIAGGKSVPQIALILGFSESCIKKEAQQILAKLNVSTMCAAIYQATKLHLI